MRICPSPIYIFFFIFVTREASSPFLLVSFLQYVSFLVNLDPSVSSTLALLVHLLVLRPSYSSSFTLFFLPAFFFFRQILLFSFTFVHSVFNFFILVFLTSYCLLFLFSSLHYVTVMFYSSLLSILLFSALTSSVHCNVRCFDPVVKSL